MIKRIKKINGFKRVVWWASALMLLQPVLGTAQTMVHVHYKGSAKLNYGDLSMQQYYKKACDQMYQQQARLNAASGVTHEKPSNKVSPFKVTGKLEDLASYTEDVYISLDNSYHATYKQGYALEQTKDKACDLKVIPHEEISIVYYKQRSVYRFDSLRPKGEEWVRDELPSARASKVIGSTMAGRLDFNVRPTGKKDRVANLLCDVAEISMGGKGEMAGTMCGWKSEPRDRLIFLGHPLELELYSQTQMGKGMESQHTADSVNLKAAYNPTVFQVPGAVKNMPFYADEPGYTQPEKEDADLDCKAEKKRTGIDPCAGAKELAKWCALELRKTGVDRCNNDDMDNESE